eukprot:3210972-Lingulodinium_polyedra.AAC.1
MASANWAQNNHASRALNTHVINDVVQTWSQTTLTKCGAWGAMAQRGAACRFAPSGRSVQTHTHARAYIHTPRHLDT